MITYAERHACSSLRASVLAAVKKDARVFVETGSHLGCGIQVALDCGFGAIHSVDEEPDFYGFCCEKFEAVPSVHLCCEDSPLFLVSVVAELAERAVIYLDAHSVARNPLLDELWALRSARRCDHTILIDDVRMFGTPAWHGLSAASALSALFAINPGYVTWFADTPNGPCDLLVAEVAA